MREKEARTVMLQVRISEETSATLDDLRRHEEDVPTRPEMARRLIERAAADARKRKR